MSRGRCAAVEVLAQGNTFSHSFVIQRNRKLNIGSPASVYAAAHTHAHTHTRTLSCTYEVCRNEVCRNLTLKKRHFQMKSRGTKASHF